MNSRVLRKPILSDFSVLIRSYLVLGFTFLLHASVIASAGGELPLRSPFATLGMERPEVLGISFLGLFLLNGWYFDGMLAIRAKIEGSVPRWLRFCRFCFAGIPLLGIYVLPGWDWIARNGKNWKNSRKTAISPPSVFFHQASHVLPFLSILVYGLNVLLLYSGLTWLNSAVAHTMPAVRRFLQALGFLCVQIDILDLRQRQPLPAATHLFLHLLSAFWFFPWPVCVMAGLVHFFLLLARPEPKLRMRDFFQGRFALGDRLDKGSGRDWWKVSGWRAWRFPSWLSNLGENLGDDGWRIVLLFRVKVLLTVFDAMAFALVLALLAKMWPVAGWVLFSLCAVTLSISILLILTGLLGLGSDFVIRHLGGALISRSSHRSSLKYLVLTQMALLSGSWIGYLLATGDSWRLGYSLLWGGWATSLSVWFFALPVHPSQEQAREGTGKFFPWIILSMSVACSGQLMLSGSTRLADLLRTTLLWTGWVSPFLGITLGFVLGRRSWGSGSGLARPGLAVCASVLPFGGLALPLWALNRNALRPQVVPALPESEGSRGINVPEKMCLPARESRDYCFSHIVPHLAAAGNLPGLFRLAEETSFLGDQIAHSKGFHRTLEDLEVWIVPAAIETKRWERFIRFLTMAIHLRGVSEDLAEPTVLRTLTEQGEFQIAQDAIQGIVDPIKRAVAKAIVAGALDSSSDIRQRLVQSLSHDLASLVLPTDVAEQERQFSALVVISQEMGHVIVDGLTPLLAERQEWSDAIWGSLAQCQAHQTGALGPEFWDLLKRIKDPDLLKRYLPDEIAARGLYNPEAVVHHVDQLALGDSQLAWLCRAALLGAITERAPEEAWSLWQRWCMLHPAPWSIEFVEQAAPFLRGLDERRLTDLAEVIENEETRAALWIAVLSANQEPQILQSALSSVERLPPDRLRLHWMLCLLSTSESLEKEEVRGCLKELSRSFYQLGYEIDGPDLCRFLNLVARFLPEDLHEEMEKVLWAPAVSSDILMAFVEESTGEELLTHLFENLDRYFYPFFPAEAEGFRAWSELLVKITSRLCTLRGDLMFLDQALRLNPEEADILRVTVVEALAAAQQQELAMKVCRSLTSKRQRYLTHLKLRQALPRSHPQVSLHDLFVALSAVEPIREEILGMKAVASAQSLSSPSVHAIIRSLQSPQEQFSILLRLAQRGSAGARGSREKRQSLEILSRSVGLVTSDARLAACIPELVDLITSRRRHRVLEIRAALQSLLSLRTVPWTVRREICESLLARILPTLSTQAEKKLANEASAIAELMAELLDDLLSDDNEKEKRSLIPVLFAVIDRLPVRVMDSFLRKSTPGDLLWLYLQGKDGLVWAWDREVEKDEPDVLILETILYLLSYCAPAVVPVGLGLLPANSFRDTLGSNLLRHGWLPAELAPEVLPLIENTTLRMSTELALGLGCKAASEEEENWLYILASLSAHQLVDPTDPRNESWLRKLWTIDPERSRPILAQGALRALSQAGHLHGMSALCLWFHSHLAPDAGNDSAQVLALCSEAEASVQRALMLFPGAPTSTNA